MNLAESESRPVLGPAGNKTRSVELRKAVSKPKNNNKMEIVSGEIKGKKSPAMPVVTNPNAKLMNSVVRKEQERKVFKSNLSMNASCSSDNSSDSSHSRASTGRIVRKSVPILRKQSVTKVQKVVSDGSAGGEVGPGELVDAKKRCAWVTPNTGMLQNIVLMLLICMYMIYLFRNCECVII